MRHYDPIVKEYFRFKQKGSGSYLVMYRTATKNITWIALVTDMTLIDKVIDKPRNDRQIGLFFSVTRCASTQNMHVIQAAKRSISVRFFISLFRIRVRLWKERNTNGMINVKKRYLLALLCIN